VHCILGKDQEPDGARLTRRHLAEGTSCNGYANALFEAIDLKKIALATVSVSLLKTFVLQAQCNVGVCGA
jgi:hypothetical protein